jgi:hypothetical protein
MGSAVEPNRWTDEQLALIVDETGDWVVTGRQGKGLGHAASLRSALDRAADYALSGAVVIAVCRLPSDNIVVFPSQIARLRKFIAEPDEGQHTLAAELLRPFDDQLTHRVN